MVLPISDTEDPLLFIFSQIQMSMKTSSGAVSHNIFNTSHYFLACKQDAFLENGYES